MYYNDFTLKASQSTQTFINIKLASSSNHQTSEDNFSVTGGIYVHIMRVDRNNKQTVKNSRKQA